MKSVPEKNGNYQTFFGITPNFFRFFLVKASLSISPSELGTAQSKLVFLYFQTISLKEAEGFQRKSHFECTLPLNLGNSNMGLLAS